ncbi:unnamed protein product, partial [Mesorhabditis spiculigera]
MMAIEIIDSDTFLGADTNFNIFTNERETNLNADQRCVESGSFYLGDLVNVFRTGSMVTRVVDGGLLSHSSTLYGTCDGAIGAVLTLAPELYRFALDVQKAVAGQCRNAMRISHEVYRAFDKDQIVVPSKGFVDGDLVESLLDMPRETARKIVQDVLLPNQEEPVDQNAENVLKLVEELSRMH